MANSRKVGIADLGKAISQELNIYHQNITDGINVSSEKAAKDLVKRTKATAPVGARGTFKRKIASKLVKEGPRGNTYAWYVKAPEHRLTHLLVHGHATKDGGRTKADPFLKNAVDEVLPEYEKNVEEVIQNGG